MTGELPPVVVEILVRSTQFDREMKDAEAKVEGFSKLDPEVRLGADMDPLEAALAKARAVLEDVVAHPWTAQLGLDQVALDDGVAAANAKLATIARNVEVTIGVNDALAEAKIAQLEAQLASLDATVAVGRSDLVLGSAGGGGGSDPLIAALAGAAGGEGGGGSAGGGLLSAMGWGKGLFGMAGFGSLLSLMGFGGEHLLATGVGTAGSIAGAGIGAGLLGLGAGGTMAVGMGTDMAGMGQAMNDIKLYRTALNQLNTAIATYGAGSLQAAQAQNHLNGVLATFPKQAQPAIVQLSNTLTKLGTVFNKLTGTAEKLGAEIMNQAVNVGMKFLPTIGKFATQNMGIIQKDLQPFFTWLQTAGKSGGLGIFTSLEKVFQSQLPTAMHAFEQGFELLSKTITIASHHLGPFIKWLNDFLTKMNGATFGKWRKFVQDMIKSFTDWFGFLKSAGKLVFALFKPAVGLGDQLAQLLTGIFTQITGWLNKTHNLLHNLFTAHAKELITGIGGLIKALLPILEGFASAFIQVITIGAKFATLVLWPVTQFLDLLDKSSVVTKLLGWAAAGLMVVAAFNRLGQWVGNLSTAFQEFNLRTWMSELGTSTEELTSQFALLADRINAGFTTALENAGLAAEATSGQLDGLGLAADAVTTQMDTAAASADAAAAAGADAAGASGLGALGGLSGILGPAGLIAGGAFMVYGLVTSLFHLGQSAVTAKKVAAAVQTLNQKLSQLPTTSVLHLQSDFLTLNTWILKADQALAKMNPTSTAGAIATARVQDLTQKMITLQRQAVNLKVNMAGLGTAFQLTAAQVTAFAHEAGINLHQALSPAQMQLFREAIMQSGTAAEKAGAKVATSSKVIAGALKAEAQSAKQNDPVLASSAQTAMALRVSIMQKTGAAAVAALINSTKGGLPALEAIGNSYGVHIPAKYLALFRHAMTTGGHVAMTNLAAAMQQALPQYTAVVHGVPLGMKQTGLDKLERNMKSGGARAMAELAQALHSKTKTVRSAASEIMAAAAKAMKGHEKTGTTVGVAIARGIANGITSQQGFINAAATAAVQSAIASARAAAQVHSPSVVAAVEVGLPIGQGIAAGIEQSTPFVISAMHQVVGAGIAGGASSVPAVRSAGIGAISPTYNVVVNAASSNPQEIARLVGQQLEKHDRQLMASLRAGSAT